LPSLYGRLKSPACILHLKGIGTPQKDQYSLAKGLAEPTSAANSDSPGDSHMNFLLKCLEAVESYDVVGIRITLIAHSSFLRT
jgi:hypothetical protein